MLRDINLYMAIPHSISNLDLKVPSGCRCAFKSALLACCCALKVPFPGTFTMPYWGAGGNTNSKCIFPMLPVIEIILHQNNLCA